MDWNTLLTTLGGTAAAVAALTYLAKKGIEQLLTKDLEALKVSLKSQADRELAQVSARFEVELTERKLEADRELERYRRQLGLEGSKQERIRMEVTRWANPILGALRELGKRLDNILKNDGYLALNPSSAEKINPNWSISYDYFLPSTLYLFAQYFCWVRLMEERLSFELFESRAEEEKLFSAIQSVRSALGHFPTRYECQGLDRQVFALQQRGIGEALIVQSQAELGCMSYHDFLSKLLEEKALEQRLEPLRRLIDGVEPEQECRWRRLQTTRETIAALQACCEELLKRDDSSLRSVEVP